MTPDDERHAQARLSLLTRELYVENGILCCIAGMTSFLFAFKGPIPALSHVFVVIYALGNSINISYDTVPLHIIFALLGSDQAVFLAMQWFDQFLAIRRHPSVGDVVLLLYETANVAMLVIIVVKLGQKIAIKNSMRT
jgi:hypothetical protein